MWKHRAKHPSADDLIAAYLGFQPDADRDRVSTPEELLAFTLFAGGLTHG